MKSLMENPNDIPVLGLYRKKRARRVGVVFEKGISEIAGAAIAGEA